MSAAAAPIGSLDRGPLASIIQLVARNAWVIALYTLAGLLLVAAKAIHPTYGSADIQSLSIGVLPIALAAAAQTVAVVAGGIDLSVGPMMAFTSVVAAVAMMNQSDGVAFLVVAGVLLLGLAAGSINGALVVLTRVPDIIVTLAMSFVWAGAALMVIEHARREGGGVGQGAVGRLVPHRVDATCPRPAGRQHQRRVDPAAKVSPGPFDVCPRQRPRRRVANRRERVPDEGHGLRRDRPVRGHGRACHHHEHRHRHPGPGPVHPRRRGGHRAGRREPGRWPRRHGRSGRRRVHPLARTRSNLFFLGVDANYSTVVQGALLVVVVMVGAVVALRRDRA